MGNSSSVTAIYPPDEYAHNEEDLIPFEPDGKDGKDPVLSSFGTAMRVVPRSGRGFTQFKIAVRKTIRITPTGGLQDIEGDKQRLRMAAKKLNDTSHHHLLNIITTYFYHGPNGVQFSIVMDYAQENLRAYLTILSSPSTATPGESACVPLAKWFGCLISVVAYLHLRGIWHKDIKPESILVKDGTTILLSNFDISEMNAWKTQPRLARWKKTAGYYSAPELEEQGPVSVPCGRAADIFSLGVVFLEMLLAHRTFESRRRLSFADSKGESPGNAPFADLRSTLQSYHLEHGNTSYASGVDAINRWLSGINLDAGKLPGPSSAQDNSWELDVLSICRNMLDTEANARPRADELLSQWKPLMDPDVSQQCPSCHTAYLEEEQKQGKHQGSTVHRTGSAAVLALHWAAGTGQVDEVISLIKLGAHVVNINEPDGAGETALLHAAANGHKRVVEVLLEAKATVKTQNLDGWSALHYAARRNYMGVVTLLLSSKEGVDIDLIELPDNAGWRALHFAARYGHKDVLEQLLANRANVAALDKMGHTALHLAARGGHVEVVGILLARQDEADVNKTSKKGHSALWFAALGNHREVLKTLVESTKADIRLLAT